MRLRPYFEGMGSFSTRWRFGGFFVKSFSALISAGLIVSAVPVAATAQPLCVFDAGSGTSADPFQVASERDLNELRTCGPNLFFLQTSDIVLTATNWQPITNHNVADSFRGSYDGGDFTISNLLINSPNGNLGLFYALESSIVSNLTLAGSVTSTGSNVPRVGLLAGGSNSLGMQNVTFQTDVSAPGANFVGGVIGFAESTSFNNLDVRGAATGGNLVGGVVGSGSVIGIGGLAADVDVSGTSLVGGAFGDLVATSAADITASGSVTATGSLSGGFAGRMDGVAFLRTKASGRVDGRNWAGGFVGYMSGSSLTEAGASGEVLGDTYVGGFVGQAITSGFSKVYASGDVTGSAFVGGFAGDLAAGPNPTDGLAISNAYAAGDVIFREVGPVTGTLGGFAGAFGRRLAITNTYAAGKVDDSLSFWGGYLGGFTAVTEIAVSNSIYDADLNSQAMPTTDLSASSVIVMGKTSTELREIDTFSPLLDIEAGQGVVGQGQKAWGICPGVNDGLPFLNWAFAPGTCDQAAAAIAAAAQAEADRLAAERSAREREALELAEQQAEAERQAAQRAAALSLGLHVWVSAYGSTEAKFYARELVGGGKVQFYLNGVEIGWIRAADRSDPKLRTLAAGPLVGEPYFVRTAKLELGHKNILEIHVDGQRVHRVAYTR